MPVINYASKYEKAVDERFHQQSQAMLALNKDYKFTGVKAVHVYSIPTVPMGDYTRSGMSRYGTPDDLALNTQELIVQNDRSFTFIIDKGDKLENMMVLDAGRALSRQTREEWVPEFDTYAFKKLAAAAKAYGGSDSTAITANNAYEMFLAGMEHVGDRGVPDVGRVCFCSYHFYNLMKQDPAFVRYGNASQEMLRRGELGEVDGCKLVRVPSTRLPAGASFLITHKCAATGVKKLEEFKIHDNPPGLSGWLAEGRVIYDVFTLNEKRDAIYYHGGQSILKRLVVQTAATATGKTTIQVGARLEGAKRYYMTASGVDGLTAVTHGTAITTSAWTELNGSKLQITPTSSHKMVRVVEVDSDNKPIAVGDALLHIG